MKRLQDIPHFQKHTGSEGVLSNAETIYIGPLLALKPHGQGKFKVLATDELLYQGILENGVPNGKGLLRVAPKTYLAGNFVNGILPKREIGVLVFPDGKSYKGKIENNLPHGQGTLKSSSGIEYTGQFRKGKRHGQGTSKSESATYTGEFRENKRHGQGILTSESGRIYTGEFREGKMHGQGTYKSESETYTGQFREDKRHGQGILTSKSGRIYTGEFREGKMHGNGTYALESDIIFEGKFEHGYAVNDSRTKKNETLLFINGDKDFVPLVNLLRTRYQEVFDLNESERVTTGYIKNLVASSTQSDKNKLNIVIGDHGTKNGNLYNKDHILKALKKILKETLAFNKEFPKGQIQHIDINLQACYGSKVVSKNKEFQDVMKSFINANIDVKVIAVGEKVKASAVINNGKTPLPLARTGEHFIINKFHLDKNTDFNNIVPFEIQGYKDGYSFMQGKYETLPSTKINAAEKEKATHVKENENAAKTSRGNENKPENTGNTVDTGMDFSKFGTPSNSHQQRAQVRPEHTSSSPPRNLRKGIQRPG